MEVTAGEQDLDFWLNFALTNDLPRVLQTIRTEGLPIPSVHPSWKAGSPIGGDAQKCMGGQPGG